MTKDRDFPQLLEQLGPPPQIIWITCGNTSNAFLKDLLVRTMPPALKLLLQGESLVEISDSV
jgi:predicted nuclease of predicted toxin-antitoxin system